MLDSNSAPGVYIEYVTDGPLTIRAASTSTAVFIGTTPVGGTIGAASAVEAFAINSAKEYAERFAPLGNRLGAVTLPTKSNAGFVDHMGHAVSGFFGNGGAKAYIVSNKQDGTGTAASGKLRLTTTGDTVPATSWSITALSAGVWGKDISVIASHSDAGAGFVNIEVKLAYDAVNAKSEVFIGVAMTALGTIASSLVRFATIADDATLTALNTTPANATPKTVTLTNGTDSTVGGISMQTILDALKDIDDISLIVLPELTWATANATDKASYTTAISHAQEMKDRMVLIQFDDAYSGNWDATGLPLTQYAAAYYPKATVATRTPAGNTLTQTVGLTGHVAGVIARTDGAMGAWTAAAGTHAWIGGIAGLTKSISQTKQGPINANNVNAVRYIQGAPSIYGARTRDKGGIYEYQPVMRTAFLIADSLREALGRAVFAKNTEVLWSNLKLSVSGFMQGLYAQGAFQGASPSQAFEVACGLGENMTQADIDGGLLRVTVRFRAAKPAEFILVSVEQLFADSL